MPEQHPVIDNALQNAKSIQFFLPERENEPPQIFVAFEDYRIAFALYSEVARVNKEKEQYLRFKKSHSSLITSFILKEEYRSHATMLLDYDKNEFDEFVKVIKPDDSYVLLFGQLNEDGPPLITQASDDQGNDKHFVVFHQYEIVQ